LSKTGTSRRYKKQQQQDQTKKRQGLNSQTNLVSLTNTLNNVEKVPKKLCEHIIDEPVCLPFELQHTKENAADLLLHKNR
jgi:hypothetical protein